MSEPLAASDVRIIQLEALDAVARHCRQSRLTWFAAAGTLIGAVRHRGFIPWDDDIDLALPRPDYEEFLATFKEPGFSVESLDHDPQCPFPFAKVWREGTVLLEESDVGGVPVGVGIDVFPIDGLPRWPFLARWHVRRIIVLRGIHALRTMRPSASRSRSRNMVLAVGRIVLRPVLPASIARAIRALASAHDFQGSRLAGIIVWQNGLGEIAPSDIFDSNVTVWFEGRALPAPVGYDLWLRGAYGDYWNPPPPSARATHHAFRAYRSEEGRTSRDPAEDPETVHELDNNGGGKG